MTEPLVRFGVAMEASLLEEFDRVVRSRGSTRSEAFRDLARAAIVRADVDQGVPAVAALTLVYDHHVRDLTEKLTELQHDLGEEVRATLHVHLDHDFCLEVIVMRGVSHELKRLADRILGMRGVKHGDIEIITGVGEAGHGQPHHKKARKATRKAAARSKGAHSSRSTGKQPAPREPRGQRGVRG